MDKDKKIWGVYNTFNEEEIDKLSEFEIWSKIHCLSREITSMINYLNKGYKDISIKALIAEEFNLDYLIYYTKKFGVKFDMEPTFGEHIKKSESFNSWYKFWNSHFESMDEEKYRNYIKDKLSGFDVSIYMPSNNWNDTIEKQNNEKKLQKAYI